MGTLHIVATPIGNLADLSDRARQALESAGAVAAEDTRVTRRLMARHGIAARLVSYHANSPPRRAAELVAELERHDLALVTDAGTPAVSDPGAALVRAARAAGHAVAAVPGPSAVAAALSVSGFPADRFTFAGFLPRTASKRRREIAAMAAGGVTAVCFEAPHRVAKALADIAELAPEVEVCVCRELTKVHEETFVGTPEAAARHFAAPKGEFVILLNASRA